MKNTILKEANKLFRNKDYNEAIKYYDHIIRSNQYYEKFLNFNMKLCEKRINDNKIFNDNNKLKNSLYIGIITTKHTIYLAEIIKYSLERHNLNVDIYIETPEYFTADYYFVLCPQIFSRLPPGEKRICFQLEQTVSTRWFDENYIEILNNSLSVLDYSLTNIENLKKYGINYPHIFYLPIGSNKKYIDKINNKKEIDLLFYGDNLSCQRRQILINKIKERFNKEINFVVVNNLFGQEMKDLIRKSKFVINIHYYEDSLLEMPRIMECISNGTFVISEISKDSNEYNYINDLVFYFNYNDFDNLVDLIDNLIKSYSDNRILINSIEHSSKYFDFMLDRILIYNNIISSDNVSNINIELTDKHDFVALAMPETIDRRKLFQSKKIKNCLIFDGIRKSPGWIGCGLSYKTIALNAIKRNLNKITIMEDDVVLPDDFYKNYKVINEYLDKTENWDMFSGLIANLNENVVVESVEYFKGIKFIKINTMTSTVFNIYNKKLLSIISEWDPSNTDEKINTIDRYIESRTNITVITTLPFFVGHFEEVTSSLWNFRNEQYNEMINKSEILLANKVSDFLNKQLWV